MVARQDRMAPRTPSDIESKYNFGKSFAEVMGVATGAEKKAEESVQAAQKIDEDLTQDEIAKRLFDGVNGIKYHDGEMYVDATYINGGTLKGITVVSENQHFKISLNNGVITLECLEAGFMFFDPMLKITGNHEVIGSENGMYRDVSSDIELTRKIGNEDRMETYSVKLKPDRITFVADTESLYSDFKIYYDNGWKMSCLPFVDHGCHWEYIPSIGKTVLVSDAVG